LQLETRERVQTNEEEERLDVQLRSGHANVRSNCSCRRILVRADRVIVR